MVRIDLTLDCADAARLARFWKLALGYEDEPPPPPFASRAEWAASFDLPVDDDGSGAEFLRDPAGRGPRLVLMEVPEPKTAKNRLHIDVRVPRGERHWADVLATVERLGAAGGAVLEAFPEHHVLMADPEGNEFCVA